MITAAYVRLMAEYNAEMNRRLYAAAARLSDAERKADRGAFWQSIHGTLVAPAVGRHAMDVALRQLAEARGRPIKQSAAMIDDFDTLRAQRETGGCRHPRLGRPHRRCLAGRGPGVVQRRGAEGDAPAEGPAGGALLQSPDASSRPGACAADRLRPGYRRYRSVPGGAGAGLTGVWRPRAACASLPGPNREEIT